MSAPAHWRWAAILQQRLGQPVTLAGESVDEFYTLGAVEAPHLELAVPLGACEAELERLQCLRAGTHWLAPDGTRLHLRGPADERFETRVGEDRFHVPGREAAIVEAARRALLDRHPRHWSALILLWAAQGSRVDAVRLHRDSEAAGVRGPLDQARRRLAE